jgi:hypothetical protein
LFFSHQQGNVIVLDLSQEHQTTNSTTTTTTLSELLQASGIMAETDINNDSGLNRVILGGPESLDSLNHRQPQQVLLQQRIPADKSKTNNKRAIVTDAFDRKFYTF